MARRRKCRARATAAEPAVDLGFCQGYRVCFYWLQLAKRSPCRVARGRLLLPESQQGSNRTRRLLFALFDLMVFAGRIEAGLRQLTREKGREKKAKRYGVNLVVLCGLVGG
jgi:hypothetical protein